MKKVVSAVVLLFVIFSCQERQTQTGFTISGVINSVPDSTLITLYAIDEQVFLDSAYTQGNAFELAGSVDIPTICWIRVDGQSEYAIISVENTAMTFSSPLQNMINQHQTRGGPEQVLQNELAALQQPFNLRYMAAMDSLMGELHRDDLHKEALIHTYQTNQEKSHEIYMDFGKNHPNSYLGLDILYRNRMRIPKDTLVNITSQLQGEYREAQLAQAIGLYLMDELVEKGKPIADFTVQTLQGEDFQLSSLTGSYVYLSFWSTGCGPCRKENKFFSAHFDSLRQDLKIVSFSTDTQRATWEKASEQDGIKWVNVSDLEGPSGIIKTRYNVQAVPTSYLIDKKGTVIEKFTGYGDSSYDEIIVAIESYEKGNS